jgi:hypothetical protein
MIEKHKNTLEPEKYIMDNHSMGDLLYDNIKQMEDPLSLDGIIQKNVETAEQKLHRNLTTANSDGPQPEGMCPPIIDFEKDALSRQCVKQQEIYET